MFKKFGSSVTNHNTVKNEEVRRRNGIEREITSRLNYRVSMVWECGKNG